MMTAGGRTALLVLTVVSAPAPARAQTLPTTVYLELSPQDRIRLDALAREQARQDAEYHARMRDAKARLLRSAPLPEARNPLLGRWRVPPASGGGKKDDLSQLLGVLGNPGRAACGMLFGDGITEFKPASWSSIDSFGDDSLGPIQYRGDGTRVWAVPESAQNIYFLTFDVVAPDRLAMIMVDDCPLVRVGAAAPASTTSRTPAPVATPPVPAPAASARPPAEVCSATFLDQLGTAGINQVRQMADRRFTSAQDGAVPGSTLVRVEGRGSACDDPRISATRFDFDTNGMLQVVTYVWARPAGPAPSPMFAERISTLSRFYTLPAAQGGRVEMDVPLGRLTLLDVPAQNQVLESYAARK